MNALILAYTLETYATQRLLSHLRARGHWALAASPLECSLLLTADGFELCHRGERLPRIDVVFPRGLTYHDHGTLVPRIVELSLATALVGGGALSFNSPRAKAIAADKLATLQQFSAAGLPIPLSASVWSLTEFNTVAARLGSPIVLKALDGSRGSGVVRCDSLASARSTFEALRSHGLPFLVQHYVSDANNVRALVIDGQVVGALQISVGVDEFRANLGQGAVAAATVLTQRQHRLAIAAAACIGLEIAGVDMLETAQETLLLEANAVPGLEALDRCCDIDAALLITVLAERRHAERARHG